MVDIVRSTLGPRGMDKLIHDGDKVVITNDGATVMRELQIQHPAARLLADISKAQDDEVRGRERVQKPAFESALVFLREVRVEGV